MWWKKRTTRKELEEDAKEDLELKDEDADNVAGGWQPQKFKSGAATDAMEK